MLFSLPCELQAIILGNLPAPDIVRSRLVSRSWNNLVTRSEDLITAACLEQQRLPRLAIRLYPPPTKPRLDYLVGIKYRLLISKKLSIFISEWVINDLFLRTNPEQRLDFAPYEALLKSRLVPLLLILFHFFEVNRQLTLQSLMENSSTNLDTSSIEMEIMRKYDNNMLFQAHRMLPILSSFLSRRLRLPTYLSRFERTLRGHLPPLPESAQVAIMSIGGLSTILRIAEIERYHPRRRWVDEWLAAISGQGEYPKPWALKTLPDSQPSSSTEGRQAMVSATPSIVRDGNQSSNRGKGILVAPSSLAAGPPMGLVSPESARLLLSAIPKRGADIWCLTAEAELKRRGVTRKNRRRENRESVLAQFTNPDSVLTELINPDSTELDMMLDDDYSSSFDEAEYTVKLSKFKDIEEA